jgi:hypothetical protein
MTHFVFLCNAGRYLSTEQHGVTHRKTEISKPATPITHLTDLVKVTPYPFILEMRGSNLCPVISSTDYDTILGSLQANVKIIP